MAAPWGTSDKVWDPSWHQRWLIPWLLPDWHQIRCETPHDIRDASSMAAPWGTSDKVWDPSWHQRWFIPWLLPEGHQISCETPHDIRDGLSHGCSLRDIRYGVRPLRTSEMVYPITSQMVYPITASWVTSDKVWDRLMASEMVHPWLLADWHQIRCETPHDQR